MCYHHVKQASCPQKHHEGLFICRTFQQRKPCLSCPQKHIEQKVATPECELTFYLCVNKSQTVFSKVDLKARRRQRQNSVFGPWQIKTSLSSSRCQWWVRNWGRGNACDRTLYGNSHFNMQTQKCGLESVNGRS